MLCVSFIYAFTATIGKLAITHSNPYFFGVIYNMSLTASIFSHMLAISMTHVAYMISLKRTSLLFGVIYGAVLFKEEKIAERLTGAAIMITGVFLIGWFG
jgi:uncharacterized membrane protein